MLQKLSRSVQVLGIVTAVGLSSPAMATQPASSGLGQSWPNTTDVSLSPHYHVYVFKRDDIRYIQVNDANGVVRGAIATADGVALVLPIGVDAARVENLRIAAGDATPSTSLGSSTETVYRDQASTVSVTPLSNGALAITMLQAANCDNPGECSNVR